MANHEATSLLWPAKGASEDWYQIEVPIVNTHTLYRFVFVSNDRYDWLNAFGP
jgi:hypothetical protein